MNKNIPESTETNETHQDNPSRSKKTNRTSHDVSSAKKVDFSSSSFLQRQQKKYTNDLIVKASNKLKNARIQFTTALQNAKVQ